MTHFDEKTLELFVLGDPAVRDAGIEDHLKDCFSCREMAEELRQIYSAFNAPRILSENSSEEPSLSIVPQYRSSYSPAKQAVKINQLFRAAVRKHPAAAAMTGGGVVIALLFALTMVFKPADEQPALFYLNEVAQRVEIKNETGALLWSLPIDPSNHSFLKAVKSEYGSDYVQIIDLNGDGKKEVLSLIGRDMSNPIKNICCYSSKGKLLWAAELGHELNFRGQPYPRNFNIKSFFPYVNSKSGRYEILISMSHSHSPSAAVRFSADGKILGSLWHFGHLSYLQNLTGKDGTVKFLISGCNDVDEIASFTVIEPEQIEGDAESPLTRGFGYPASSAVDYYVTVRQTIFNPGSAYRYSFTRPDFVSDNEFSMIYGTTGQWVLSYVFDRSMNLKAVLTTDQGRDFYNGYLRTGKTTKPFDPALLDSQRKGVMIWRKGEPVAGW